MQGSAPRWRAFLLSCVLCGKCCGDQDQENGQDSYGQAAEEEPMPSTSQQEPQVQRRESLENNAKGQKKKKKLRVKKWFARVLARQRATAQTAGAAAEEQGTSSSMGEGGHHYIVEACLEALFHKQEREQKRLAETFYIRRHKIMVDANRVWDRMPLKDIYAPSKVYFEEPLPRFRRPTRSLMDGSQWLRDPKTQNIIQQRQPRPMTATMSTLVQPVSEPKASQSKISQSVARQTDTNAPAPVWARCVVIILYFSMFFIAWVLDKQYFSAPVPSNMTSHH